MLPLNEGVQQWLKHPMVVDVVKDCALQGHQSLHSCSVTLSQCVFQQGVHESLVADWVGQQHVSIAIGAEEAIRADSHGWKVSFEKWFVASLHNCVEHEVRLDAEEAGSENPQHAENDERSPEETKSLTF